jgi:hypothetical protein
MAGRRPKRLGRGAIALATSVSDPATDKAIDQVRDAAQRALDRVEHQTIGPIDLAIGRNVVPHSLGRVPAHVSVLRTAAGADWYVDRDLPNPERAVAIVVSGAALPRTSIQVS